MERQTPDSACRVPLAPSAEDFGASSLRWEIIERSIVQDTDQSYIAERHSTAALTDSESPSDVSMSDPDTTDGCGRSFDIVDAQVVVQIQVPRAGLNVNGIPALNLVQRIIGGPRRVKDIKIRPLDLLRKWEVSGKLVKMDT